MAGYRVVTSSFTDEPGVTRARRRQKIKSEILNLERDSRADFHIVVVTRIHNASYRGFTSFFRE